MIKLRNGFSLLVAVFTILLLSLVSSYIFYASSSIAKEGGIQYQQEQARLLARSYTEYAVLAISGNNRDKTKKCIDEITADIGTPDTGQGYRIKINITYIGNKKYTYYCSHKAFTLAGSDEDTLSVILDVYVKYKDSLHQEISNAPWQVYHKRSLQKI